MNAFRSTMLEALDEKQHSAFEAYLSEQVEVMAEAFPNPTSTSLRTART